MSEVDFHKILSNLEIPLLDVDFWCTIWQTAEDSPARTCWSTLLPFAPAPGKVRGGCSSPRSTSPSPPPLQGHASRAVTTHIFSPLRKITYNDNIQYDLLYRSEAISRDWITLNYFKMHLQKLRTSLQAQTPGKSKTNGHNAVRKFTDFCMGRWKAGWTVVVAAARGRPLWYHVRCSSADGNWWSDHHYMSWWHIG